MKLIIIAIVLFSFQSKASQFWMELKAKDKYERTELIQQGFDIVAVEEGRVVALGDEKELYKASQLGVLLYQYKSGFSPFDFPTKDADFHNYRELTDKLNQLAAQAPELMTLSSIGQSHEGRELWAVRLSALPEEQVQPGILFMGGHHAREHVSVEIPLRLVDYLVNEYQNKNPRVVSLLNQVEVFFIPLVNPDGKEHDISGDRYRFWRKNRNLNNNGSYGVDLNRNYGFEWGGAGASENPSSDTYRGPAAFSEPETQAVKKFVEDHLNITTLLSYHTFSQLILWPWGHVEGEISNTKDLEVFKTMGDQMAQWTGYKPMKSGDLYLASGDTCDWAYGEHGIFAFTFELDPKSIWNGGFYPGQGVLDSVFDKNLEPALYLIEKATDPYQVL